MYNEDTDLSLDDYLFDEPDYGEIEKYENDPKRHEYAKSLVGKYCICQSETTDFLKNLLCKVVKQGDSSRGGNKGQVHIIVYRNNERFEFRKWWFVGTRDWLQCIDSSHIVPTSERPKLIERIKSPMYIIARIITSTIETDYLATIKYKWAFKDTSMHFCMPPLSSLLMACVDTVRAFKYGVILNR